MASAWDSFASPGSLAGQFKASFNAAQQPAQSSTPDFGAWSAFVTPAQQPSAPDRISRQDFVQGLIKRGLTPTMAEGIAMNAHDESGFRTGVDEASGGGGKYLIQWTGPRRTAYEAFAAQKGVNPADPNAQMDYIVQELHGPEHQSYVKMQEAQTPGQAADAFLRYNERPAAKYMAERSARYLNSDPAPATLPGAPSDYVNAQPAPAASTYGSNSANLWQTFVGGPSNG